MTAADAPRYLITRIARHTTTTGKEVINLFTNQVGQRRFPCLVLFEAAMLRDVGIDPNTMPRELHTRFFAYYRQGERINQYGQPYRDVEYLQPVPGDTPTPDQHDGTDEALAAIDESLQQIADQLRTITALLNVITQATSHQDPAVDHPGPDPQPDAQAIDELFDGIDLAPSDGDTDPDPAPPQQRQPPPTLNLDQRAAREQFYSLATEAIRTHTLTVDQINALAKAANQDGGWPASLRQLQAATRDMAITAEPRKGPSKLMKR
jgi:hypothetical protein